MGFVGVILLGICFLCGKGLVYLGYGKKGYDALKELDLSDYDLIISSESGPAKGVVPNPDAFHLCYCHSPMRYLWDMYHEYFRTASGFVRFFMKKLVPSLRLWDVMSANLVDCFVANSHYKYFILIGLIGVVVVAILLFIIFKTDL